jgi:FkbM family methyltransferase
MKPKNTLVYHLPWYSRLIQHRLKRRLRKHHKKVRSKNYPLLACVPSDAVGQWIVLQGLYEEVLLLSLFTTVFRNFLPQFKEQAVIDGGANIGNHALFFSRYFKQVIAFEPNPSALKLLDTNIFLNKTKNIHVIPIGLSNEFAVLPFREDPQNLGGSGFDLEDPSFDAPVQQLSVEKGDHLLEQHAKEAPIALIKLDIEGYELKALQGLEKTIKTYQPIILFEAHGSEGKQGAKAVFNYLLQHNYRYFYTIEPKKTHPFFLIKLFERLKGYNVVLTQISEPEDRYYPLIIATTTALQ